MLDLVVLFLVSLGWRDFHELHHAMAELGFDTSAPEVRDAIMAHGRMR